MAIANLQKRIATDNNVGDKKQRFLLRENGDIIPLTNCQQWIPVTERLPEIRERVLVYHDDGMIRFGINYGGFADVVSSIYLNNNHSTCFSKVTHWMPLPNTEGLK